MARKTFVSVKRGLTQDPKHRERMGNRIWLFLHIIDRADFETGMVYDYHLLSSKTLLCPSILKTGNRSCRFFILILSAQIL